MYATFLRDLAEARAIFHGQAIHCRILKTIPNPRLFLFNSLVNMYTKCGFVHDGFRVFDQMAQRDVISWNTIIDGYLLSCGFCGSAFVVNGLIEAYTKFCVLRESMKVFVDVEHKDIVLVSNMIGLLVKAGNLEEAFVIFLESVLASPMQPQRAIFVRLLGGINCYEILREGLQVHGLIVKCWFEADSVVENSLVMMYCNCDHVDDAFALLVQSGSKNPMSWTSLINGKMENISVVMNEVFSRRVEVAFDNCAESEWRACRDK
ncbi:hypothetical protein J5N97_003075 [Dioscorea zingiberensis]|uniref:Pentatricopeptide repeat-containing protein n=1 Tax=Dioscorea zingiberensis TaxID=325984 RepID=A0A9D5D4X8_9LILI|nr:hypothetical protein J5N97_003075 [Dioscorea zingiberensis]